MNNCVNRNVAWKSGTKVSLSLTIAVVWRLVGRSDMWDGCFYCIVQLQNNIWINTTQCHRIQRQSDKIYTMSSHKTTWFEATATYHQTKIHDNHMIKTRKRTIMRPLNHQTFSTQTSQHYTYILTTRLIQTLGYQPFIFLWRRHKLKRTHQNRNHKRYSKNTVTRTYMNYNHIDYNRPQFKYQIFNTLPRRSHSRQTHTYRGHSSIALA